MYTNTLLVFFFLINFRKCFSAPNFSAVPAPNSSPDDVNGRMVTIMLTQPSNENGIIRQVEQHLCFCVCCVVWSTQALCAAEHDANVLLHLSPRRSHYQIAVVLLPEGNFESLLPPDQQFPSLANFANYEAASSYGGSVPLAYITAEFAGGLFPADGRFTVGDETQPNDRAFLYGNGPLRYDSTFTFFLRAYPLIPNSQVFFVQPMTSIVHLEQIGDDTFINWSKYCLILPRIIEWPSS